MQLHLKTKFIRYSFICILLLGACKTIAPFHQETFVRTAALKAKMLVLINHSNEPFAVHADKIDDLMIEAHSLYALQKARPLNVLSAAQWKILMDNDPVTKQSILPGFFELWKEKQTLSPAFTETAAEQVSAAFDEILKLEGAKLKI